MMNDLFDWAIFGEIDRRHGLINSSRSGEMQDRLDRLAALSDRPSVDPPSGTILTPYLSGFPYERWYVLMRTFPDPAAARGGMVRSFCVLLPIDRIDEINNLFDIIDCLPANNSSSSEWDCWKGNDFDSKQLKRQPIEIPDSTLSIRLGFINALFKNNLPGVWSQSQDEFEDIIVEIWALLPSAFRSILRFGHSHSPKDLGEPKPHFITTPNSAISRWQESQKIESLNREPSSRAELFLLGKSPNNSFTQFLSSLPALSEFSQLQQADRCLEAFEDAEGEEISQAVSAAGYLGQLAPELDRAIELKERALSILEKILQADVIGNIRYFANLRLDAFSGAEERLGKFLTASIEGHFETSHNLDRELVEWAFDGKTVLWWRQAASGAIAKQLANLSLNLANSLWDWWLSNPNLVLHLQLCLPSNADLLLYQTAPDRISKEIANSILEVFSQNLNHQSNSFPRLLTYLQVRSEIPNDIVIQTCLQRSSDVDLALNTLRKCIGDRTFLNLALTVTDERVFKEVGISCFEDPTLLNRIAPENTSWRKIWLAAIQAGAEPLTGILDPNLAMTIILNELRSGNAVDRKLLIHLSITAAANLTNYAYRPQIWSILPSEAIGGFLKATAKGVFDRWRKDSSFQPESELTHSILSLGYFTEAVRHSDRGLNEMTSGYMAVVASANGTSSNAEEIIQTIHEKSLTLPDVEVKKFADWIKNNNFKQIAEMGVEYYNKSKNITLCAFIEYTFNLLPLSKKISAMKVLKDNNRQIPSSAELERSIKKRDSLQEQWNLQHQKLTRMRNALVIETDPSVKFKLGTEIKDEEIKLNNLENELKSIEG